MPFPDLTTLSDEDLRDGYREYAEKISRRHELGSGPQRVREISERHCEIGGDPQDLVDQIRTVTAGQAASGKEEA